MEILQSFYENIISAIPVSLVIALSILVIIGVRYFIDRQYKNIPE